MTREITLDDIESPSAWILGTGAGGSPYLGLLACAGMHDGCQAVLTWAPAVAVIEGS
jgi:DUF917 family protein